jgi:hypothetical protein
MIEDAFRYRRHERYVSLGFGVHGGVMSDFIHDSVRPISRDLYGSFLLHPAMKPYTDAFRIETEPPKWLVNLSIDEVDAHQEEFETWSGTSRCLLLDRAGRQFFVDTVARVREWLLVRVPLLPRRERATRPAGVQKMPAREAEKALFDWLALQPIPVLSRNFLDTWARNFHQRQIVAGCAAAGVKLGFDLDDLADLLSEALSRNG